MCIVLLPILMIALISFAKDGSWTWQILPTAFTIENYARLFSEPQVFEPMGNSLLMSVLTVAAASVVGVSLAYIVTKGGLKSSRFVVDILATMPFAIPGTVVALGLILAFNTPTLWSARTILVGTFWILPLAYFVRTFPLIVRSTSASLQQVDDSLLEAGKTFGAGALRCFRRITLPIILPGIISGALLVMITALGEFVSSVLLYSYSNRPIAVEILAQMRAYNFGSAAAYSVLLLVLILCLTFIANLFSDKTTTTSSTLNG
jgi:iron(III) transport system permease protein